VANVRRALRILFIVVVLSILGVVVFQVVKAQQSAQPEPIAAAGPQVIDETTAEQQDMTVTVSATGTVIPNHKVNLSFEVSAPVSEILVKEGQRVKAGDVLARLDTTDVNQALQTPRSRSSRSK